MYNVNIPFYSESSSTRWRQILPRRIVTRASCSSELLYRSLSDPKRLLMSRRSESDKLLRPRITARADIFPENAGRSLCSRVSSPPLVSSFFTVFTVFSYVNRRWWYWRTGEGQRAPKGKGLRRRAANLFAHFYLRGICDRVNHRVNRIRSYPIPKEAYGLRDCNRLPRYIVIAIDRVPSTHGRKLDFAYETRVRANSISRDVLREVMSWSTITFREKGKKREKSLGFIFEIPAMNVLLFLTLRNIVPENCITVLFKILYKRRFNSQNENGTFVPQFQLLKILETCTSCVVLLWEKS